MRYSKPFTLAQRQDAIAACRAFNAQLKAIRLHFRPKTGEQIRVARELRKAVQDLVDALRMPDAKVDAERVNTIRERADELGVRYSMLWLDWPRSPGDT